MLPRHLFLPLLALSVLQTQAQIFTCENSTLLYSVKSPEDEYPMVILQTNNITRVFYQDQKTGLWDKEMDVSRHRKTCDFRVIAQPKDPRCVTTIDGGDDRDLKMCSGTPDPYLRQVVAEHLVLVACSTSHSAFAKVANAEGSLHFLVAFHSMEDLEASEEWDKANFTQSVNNFMRKQVCDEKYPVATSSSAFPSALAAFTVVVILWIIL